MKVSDAVDLTLGVIGQNGFDGIRTKASSLPAALSHAGLDKLSTTTRARVAAELRRQQLIEITKLGNEFHIQLSVKGIHRLQRAQVTKLTIPEPATWNGRWCMVTYDVPRTMNKERRLFADQLRRLGFTMARESVWFHPYPCFDILSELTTYCGLQRYVTIAEISQLDNVTLAKLRWKYPL